VAALFFSHPEFVMKKFLVLGRARKAPRTLGFPDAITAMNA
jgi:hypothetical protein